MEKLLIEPYTPSNDEPYMNEKQIQYYKNRLIMRKMKFIRKTNQSLRKIKNLKSSHADIIDWGFLMDVEREIRNNE